MRRPGGAIAEGAAANHNRTGSDPQNTHVRAREQSSPCVLFVGCFDVALNGFCQIKAKKMKLLKD